MAKKGTTTTNKVETDPRLQRVQNWLYDNAQGAGFEGYDGQRVAGADQGTMQQLKDMYSKGMGGFGQGFDLLSGMMGQTPDASQFNNPFQQQVADAANQGYDAAQTQAFNQLDRNAAGKGGFRNARMDLGYGAAAGDIANQRAQYMGDLQYKGYMDSMDRARQQQQDQIGLGQGMVNLGMGAAGQQQGLQEYLRGLQQQGLDADYGEFLRRQDQPYKQAGLMSMAGQGAFGGTSTQTQQKGWLDNIVGMGSQIAGSLLGKGGGGGGGDYAPGASNYAGSTGMNQAFGSSLGNGDIGVQQGFNPWAPPQLNANYSFGSASPLPFQQ